MSNQELESRGSHFLDAVRLAAALQEGKFRRSRPKNVAGGADVRHFSATLLRGTGEDAAGRTDDVYITDWHNPRDIFRSAPARVGLED